MQKAEKDLAQLERIKKHVTYVVRMYPISEEAKFLFDRDKIFPIENLAGKEFYGEVIIEFPIYYPEKYHNIDSLHSFFVHQMELSAGKWNQGMASNTQIGFMVSGGRANDFPRLEYKEDYDVEIIEKIVHTHDDYSEIDDIVDLSKEKKENE